LEIDGKISNMWAKISQTSLLQPLFTAVQSYICYLLAQSQVELWKLDVISYVVVINFVLLDW